MKSDVLRLTAPGGLKTIPRAAWLYFRAAISGVLVTSAVLAALNSRWVAVIVVTVLVGAITYISLRRGLVTWEYRARRELMKKRPRCMSRVEWAYSDVRRAAIIAITADALLVRSWYESADIRLEDLVTVALASEPRFGPGLYRGQQILRVVDATTRQWDFVMASRDAAMWQESLKATSQDAHGVVGSERGQT